ncbi:antigen WC1.1-like [Dasypus novemcinctus]|uniref:antigen WC1.1-like n=1 Tax=Dasypus novemcinctus TaxID=9361 RepID=UPI00265F7531|nr:antigen WC1.1-like [Dasypus novemcinctus]
MDIELGSLWLKLLMVTPQAYNPRHCHCSPVNLRGLGQASPVYLLNPVTPERVPFLAVLASLPSSAELSIKKVPLKVKIITTMLQLFSQTPSTGSNQLRLADGGGRCAGRVEVLHQGSWGTICDYGWTLNDAHVVCRQMECGVAISATISAHFGEGSGYIWLLYMKCTGKESQVWNCPNAKYGPYACTHENDAGVICSGFVRLAGRDGPCSGRVEVHSGGDWTPVSDRNFTLPTAQVICAELQCGKAVSVVRDVPFQEAEGQVWAEGFRCKGQEQELWFCPKVPCPGDTCNHSGAVRIVCSEYTEVRLMKNGSSQCEGQVEMNISGGWRALCASHWNMANANVVCSQLGCGVANSTPEGAYFVEGDDGVWKHRFHCSGAESFLWQCPVTALGIPDCTHGNTASVICSGNQTQVVPRCNDFVSDHADSADSEESAANCSEFLALRLVSEDHDCAGWLEVFYNGTWGSVCRSPMEPTTLTVICRQLGCGDTGHLSVSAGIRATSQPHWVDGIQCRKSDPTLWQCASDAWDPSSCPPNEAAHVICAGDSFVQLEWYVPPFCVFNTNLCFSCMV